jgi:DNA-binding transcriptional LysR family regulator
MDLKQLEYFVRVAELGSFTRASAVLDIAQPALSRQVRLLEVELRLNLLTRNCRGVTPTEAGRLLLDHGRGILHQVARTREELGRVHGALAGRVSLGLPPSIAKALTVPLTREFRMRLPRAALSVSEGLSISMQEGLTSVSRALRRSTHRPTAGPYRERMGHRVSSCMIAGRERRLHTEQRMTLRGSGPKGSEGRRTQG